MEKAELRRHVLEALRQEPQTHVHAVETRIRRLSEAYERHDVLLLQEILWDLLVQGVVAPGKNSLNLNLPFVHVTEYGMRCLEEDALLLHDPDGYLERLVELGETLVENGILEAVREAVLCFLAGRHAASAVMLAAAGERLLDRLAETLLSHVSGTQQRRAARARLRRAERRVRRRFETIQAIATWIQLPDPLRRDLEVQLAGLLPLILIARDETGMWAARPISRDVAHANLLLFPEVVAVLAGVRAYLDGSNG